MVYRIEVSANNRAGCKNTECKNAGIKIFKGQMRFGAWVEGPEFQSWAWKHWGCVTPKQITNLKKELNGDATELDGYEDLLEEFQEKIRNAVRDGHVADEDWGGDVEMNRPGMNGYRTPASKKAKKESNQVSEDAGSPAPKKRSAKKRGHVKDEPDEESVQREDPAPKKRKVAAKAEKKVKAEEHQDESADDTQPIKTGRKKSTKVKVEVDSEDGEDPSLREPPVKRTRAPRKAATAKEVENEGTDSKANQAGVTSAPPPPAGKKASRKSANAVTVKEDDPSSKIAAKDAVNAADPAAALPKKKARVPRKTAAAKNIKAEDASQIPSNAIPVADENSQPASGAQDITSNAINEEDNGIQDDAEVSREHNEATTQAKNDGKKVKKIGSGKGANQGKTEPPQDEVSRGTSKPKRANGRVTRSHES